jgi:transposase
MIKRDANTLGAFLWNNRKLLKDGQRPNDIRRILPASPDDAEVRQLANFRQHLVKQRATVINKTKSIINKHNLSHDAPTENYATQKFRKWIQEVPLPVADRLEVDRNLRFLELCDEQIIEVESELVKRAESSKEKVTEVCRLKAIPGISLMGAIILLSRIGDIKRFKNPDSLANYFLDTGLPRYGWQTPSRRDHEAW